MLLQQLVPLLDAVGGGGSGMTLSMSPPGAIVAYNPTSGASFNSPNRTVVVTGGVGPFTFSWDSGDGVITTNSPSSATTSWHYHGSHIASYDEIFCVCTVNDIGAGTVAYISQDVYMQAGGSPP